MTVLPGEDPAGFRKLQEDLFAEFAPDGPLEEDIVETIARLTWRKQNLLTYGMAATARNLRDRIELSMLITGQFLHLGIHELLSRSKMIASPRNGR